MHDNPSVSTLKSGEVVGLTQLTEDDAGNFRCPCGFGGNVYAFLPPGTMSGKATETYPGTGYQCNGCGRMAILPSRPQGNPG